MCLGGCLLYIWCTVLVRAPLLIGNEGPVYVLFIVNFPVRCVRKEPSVLIIKSGSCVFASL